MMGDIAIRRVLSHVTKALSCPRSPVVTAPSCPLRHHSPASSLAVPAPDTMASSSETDSPSSTTAGSLHSLTRSASRRDGDELGPNPLSPISSAPSVSSSQQSPSSLPMFPLTDSTATPGAKANSYTSASPEEAPNSADASPRSAADRQSACPFASAAKAKELGATAKSSNLLSSQAPEVATQPSSSKSSIGVEQIRPFNDLPCPPGWPILGSFVDYFKKENKGQMHELMRRRHREFGKIFREQFGPRQNVVIADPGLMAEILRKEGKYPTRPPYEGWVFYKKLRRKDGGLMTSENEYWKRSRGVLAAKLRPRAVADYVPIMNEVCTDFLDRIAMLKVPATGSTTKGNPSQSQSPAESSQTAAADGDNSSHMDAPHTVPRMLNELNKFTMETILYVTINTRVGCLEPKPSEKVDSFIKSIATMFLTGHQLMVYCFYHKLLSTRPWRDHVQSWDTIYEFASQHVNQGIDEVTRELESTSATVDDGPVSFLKHVVGTQQLTRPQILDNIIEVLMAGIETTASALAFLLYLLAKNESAQGRLVAEVDDVVGGRTPSSEDLQRMPFLKACVKETLRLFPPIPINARTTTEDCTLGGYFVPKDTILMMNLYAMSRDEKLFSNPDEFHPERWLREGRGDNEPLPHPFSLLPFGSGVRSCVGRRVAEMQMYLTTIQILQRYSLKKSEVFDIKPYARTQLTPGRELPVMFLER